MLSVTMSLLLRVHGGVDVRAHRDAHKVASIFLEKMLSLFCYICEIRYVSRCKVDFHVGIHVTFSFCIHTQGRTTRAAKVTATQFSNVRYFSVTVGHGEDV